VRYHCSHCEFAATQAGDLKIHIENKHEGVRYPCDQCDHAATTARSLKEHIEKNMKE